MLLPVKWVPGSGLASYAVQAWIVEAPPDRQARTLILNAVKAL